jgi:hypothetical protein
MRVYMFVHARARAHTHVTHTSYRTQGSKNIRFHVSCSTMPGPLKQQTFKMAHGSSTLQHSKEEQNLYPMGPLGSVRRRERRVLADRSQCGLPVTSLQHLILYLMAVSSPAPSGNYFTTGEDNSIPSEDTRVSTMGQAGFVPGGRSPSKFVQGS